MHPAEDDVIGQVGHILIAPVGRVTTFLHCALYADGKLLDYRQFYLYFKDIEIWHSQMPNLTWTHYRELLTVSDDTARPPVSSQISDILTYNRGAFK